MEVEPGKIIEELLQLVNDELKVVSYKWLARNFAVPANFAKKLLFKFSEQQREKIKTTYLISGWTKDSGQHVFKVVDSPMLQAVRQQLEPVTSMHVYSVAPTTPVDPISLWQEDMIQSKELLKESHISGPTSSPSVISFVNNGCSAIKFVPEKRKPRPAGGIAHAAAQASAGLASAPAPAKAAALPKDIKSSAPEPAAPSTTAEVEAPEPAAKSEVDNKLVAASAKHGTPNKSKGNALSNLWNKAAAAKAKEPSAKVQIAKAAPVEPAKAKSVMAAPEEPAKAKSAKAAPEEPAKARSAKAAPEEPAEELFTAAARSVKRAHCSALDDSDDEEVDARANTPSGPANNDGGEAGEGKEVVSQGKAEAPKKRGRAPKDANKDADAPAKRAKGSKAVKKAAEAVEDDDAGPLKPTDEKDSDTVVVDDSSLPEQPKPAKPSIFEMQGAKAGATTKVQKKVQKTSYNEKGEEVVEEVYEEVEVPVGSVEHKQANLKDDGANKTAPRASPFKAKAPAPAAKSKPVGKKAPGQKGIQAFFQKK